MRKNSKKWNSGVSEHMKTYPAESELKRNLSGLFLKWMHIAEFTALRTVCGLEIYYPGFLTLQADSLPSEPQEKPYLSLVGVVQKLTQCCKSTIVVQLCPILCDGLQHARLPCPSSFPGACSNSVMPSSHLFVIPFSSCLLSFPASGSFPVSQLFASGSQSIGASASALVLLMNIQDLFPLGMTGLISL